MKCLMDEPNWLEGVTGHPGGRDVMKYVIDTYYRKNRPGYTGYVPGGRRLTRTAHKDERR
jgi:hypothetical protein